MKRYVFHIDSNVYSPEEFPTPFNYSDGDEFENNLYEIISSAKDLSLGSPELNRYIVDWNSKYHLSERRADLLRPLSGLLKKEVLEIGSGCGALTRYLGELGANVVALEGSPKRAQITAARCRDLKNVKTYCDNFIRFETDKKFDAITLIGVLEYSRIYGDSNDPILQVLKKAKQLLAPHGKLIIAIENQLGLKYFAGAPEDHLGVPFTGIENKYPEKGPATFGKKVITNFILTSGYKTVEFLYPFPDYKLPLATLCDAGVSNETLYVPDLLKFKIDHPPSPYLHHFDLNEAFPVIYENKLIPDLSNSFLIVAHLEEKKILDKNILAYTFSSSRKKSFCKFNVFQLAGDQYCVAKEKNYPAALNNSRKLDQTLKTEKYLKGSLYINGLIKKVGTAGWTLEEIKNWAQPWIDNLLALTKADPSTSIPYLEGKYFDATPFNLCVTAGHSIPQFFDLEWIVNEKLRIDYVVFRGLYYSLLSIGSLAQPQENEYQKLADLSLAILSFFFAKESLDLNFYEEQEKQILGEIFDRVPERFFDVPVYIKDSQLQPTSTHTITDLLFQSLDEISVQVFWKGEGQAFSEENSVRQYTKPTEQINAMQFNMTSANIGTLRFDIGDKPGVLVLHEIKIKSTAGKTAWTWNQTISHKENAILIESNEQWPPTIIQISTAYDPQIEIKIDPFLQPLFADGCTVEVAISLASRQQLTQLNTGIDLLSSDSSAVLLQRLNTLSTDVKERLNDQQQVIFDLQEDKAKLNLKNTDYTRELELKTQELHQAQEERNKLVLTGEKQSQHLIAAIDSKEKELLQVNAEKIQLIHAAELMQNQIVSLTETIQNQKQSLVFLQEDVKKEQTEIQLQQKIVDTIIKEKEALTAQLAQSYGYAQQLDLETKKLMADKSGLNEVILENKNSIHQLSTEKESLTKDLQVITGEKANLINKSNALASQLADIIAQNKFLISKLEINEQNISHLSEEKKSLLNQMNVDGIKTIEIEQTLAQAVEQNNKHVDTINKQRELINRFNNFYQKRNLAQVVWSKLLGKTINS